jgi:5-methylcytosine-specific restriction endonuclease McrA
MSAYNTVYRQKNRAALDAYITAWRIRNPDKAAVTAKAATANRRARKCRGTQSKITSADIKMIYASQRGRCAACRKRVAQYHVDHIVPLLRGGAHEKRNLQILCAHCNLTKHAKDPIDFMRSKGYLL